MSESVLLSPYVLQVIPPAHGNTGEGVLSFTDHLLVSQGHSDPSTELSMVTEALSLFLDTQVEVVGTHLNGVNASFSRQHPEAVGHLFATMNAQEVARCLQRLLSFEDGRARQFLRSCNCYASALRSRAEDAAFAFFLLSTAVECLSSSTATFPGGTRGSTQRFVGFIREYLPASAQGDLDAAVLDELLRIVYGRIRSGFTHSGREVSNASALADKSGLRYVKVVENGSPIKTPGLRWFLGVVRTTLITYLEREASLQPDNQRLSRLAAERGVINVVAARPIVKGQAVTLDDIEHR